MDQRREREEVKVSIVIPVYNAINYLNSNITQVDKVLRRLSLDYEILLRDDGSSDGSRQALPDLVKKYPQRVQYTLNQYNQGLGFTLRKLFESTTGDIIIYLDCDLPYGESIVADLLQEIKTADVVIASRYVGKNKIKRSFLRIILSRMYWLLCKLLFNVPVRDISSGAMALRRNVVENLNLRSMHFEILAEIFAKSRRQGYRVKEIGVGSFMESKGNLQLVKHGIPTVFSTLKISCLMTAESLKLFAMGRR